MRWLLIIGVSFASSTAFDLSVSHLASASQIAGPRVILDNPRVRVYRTPADALTQVPHGPAVVVSLEESAGSDAGSAVWLEDAAAPAGTSRLHGTIVVVQPRRPAPSPVPPTGSKPGDAPFTGMSFRPLFENDRVSVIRARMEVGAREGFHTHGSDTIVVHLSGGEIEDTADGKTVVNRWQRGDVEFEGVGTSHSARNVGGAVDVVLVALKP
jgi:quercetin dioxygenase-like cupin family protein